MFSKLSLGPNSALREPLFQRFFVVLCQSTMGTWMLRFPLAWMAWELTHSAFWVGVFSACMLLPVLFLAPLFGVLTDRISPRNGMLVTSSSLVLISMLAGAATLAGIYSLAGLIVTALLIGVITAAHQPMRLSLLPELVSREGLPSAIGISAVIFNTARIIGPALAGLIIAHTSAAWAVIASGVLFGGSGLGLLRIKLAPKAKGKVHKSVVSELMEGFRFAASHPAIRLVLTLTLVNGLLGRTVLELLPAISGKLIAGDAAQLAWLTGSAGVGSIIGGLWITRSRDNEQLLLKQMFICLAAAALLLMPLYWLATPLLLTPLVGVLSLFTTVVGVSGQALAQLCVDENFRGRVMSMWSLLIMGGPAVGSFAIGAFADQFGFVLTLLGLALVALPGLGLLWLRVGRRVQVQPAPA